MTTFRHLLALACPMFSLFFLISCEGAPGKDGINLVGDHVVPPTIELIHPMPPREFNRRMFVEAIASDNSIITQVELLLNGKEVVVSMAESPWSLSLDLTAEGVQTGTHHLQAIATDIYDRKVLSSVVFFRRTTSLNPTRSDTLSYHATDEAVKWRFPPRDGKITGFGTRFSPEFISSSDPFEQVLDVEKIWATLAITEADTSLRILDDLATLSVWTSINGYPDSLVYSAPLRSDNGLEENGLEFSRSLSFRGQNVRINSEFIVTFTMDSIPEPDTVMVMTDDGRWRNGHSLIRENGIWREFRTNPYTAYNLLLSAQVNYLQ